MPNTRSWSTAVVVVAMRDSTPVSSSAGRRTATAIRLKKSCTVAAATSENYHIVKERHLRLIPEGGVFVNVGRGSVVDEAALARVAREGRLQIALDVFEQEPLPTDSPLRGLPNVTLLPHLGGPTRDRRRDSGALALKNLRAYLHGEPLEAVVTLDVYDRSS